jgi:hypothetical protein
MPGALTSDKTLMPRSAGAANTASGLAHPPRSLTILPAEDRGACRLQACFGFIEQRVWQVERTTVAQLEAGAIGAQRRAHSHDRHAWVEPERERVTGSVGYDLTSGA